MKRSFAAKLLGIVLAFAVVIVPILGTFSYARETGYEMDCPNIYIHGFMGTDLYVDPENPDLGKVWPPATDDILAAVKAILPDLGKLILTHDWQAFSDAAMPYVYDLMSPAFLKPDATVADNSGPKRKIPPASSINSKSKLDFSYDWRLDPIEVADELNEFIGYVIESSGCDKVTIECHSFGGVIANTYATLYGNEKIKSICYNTTAIYGETYTGELLTGQIRVSTDSLTEYLKMAVDKNEYRELIKGIFDLLDAAGLTDAVVALGNKLIENLAVDASREVLAPMFGGWPSIWAMTEDDDIDAAMDYVFNTVYKDSDVDRSALIAKIEDYNTRIRPYKEQTLRAMNENAGVYVIARYGYSGLFLTPSWTSVTDGVVDTKNSSFGATVAPYGETLSEDYLAKADAKYISPDKTVDASTCLFPDQTWIIRRYPHADNCRAVTEMVFNLLYSEEQATVDTFEKYPQFLYYDLDTDSVCPDTLQDAERFTFTGRLKLIMQDIFKLIKMLFGKIFNR